MDLLEGDQLSGCNAWSKRSGLPLNWICGIYRDIPPGSRIVTLRITKASSNGECTEDRSIKFKPERRAHQKTIYQLRSLTIRLPTLINQAVSTRALTQHVYGAISNPRSLHEPCAWVPRPLDC